MAYLPVSGSSPRTHLVLSMGPDETVLWAHPVMCSLGVRAGRSQVLKDFPLYKRGLGHSHEEPTRRGGGPPRGGAPLTPSFSEEKTEVQEGQHI